MAMICRSNSGCGVDELKGVAGSTPDAVLMNVLNAMKDLNGGYGHPHENDPTVAKVGLRVPMHLFYSFTAKLDGTRGGSYPQGTDLAEALGKHNLGSFYVTPSIQNRYYHKDHNTVCLVWTPDPERVVEYFRRTAGMAAEVVVDVEVKECPACGFGHPQPGKGVWAKWPPTFCKACGFKMGEVTAEVEKGGQQ